MNDQPPTPPPGVHNGREQAFATAPCALPNGIEWGTPGLSKREFIAAAVLQGLAAYDIAESPGHLHFKETASTAVAYADSLLAELERPR